MAKIAGVLPRVGIVGCGYWGRNLVRNFSDLGALACVADTFPATAKAMSEKYDVPAVDVRDMLGASEIDGVVISVPAAQHFTIAAQALEAGKHVYVEKPLALGIAQGEELCRLAENNRRVLMVGHLLQYHPAFLRLKELVREGHLGRLQYLYSNRLNLGKIRREENILWSFAPHDISMILSLVTSPLEEVMAVRANFLHSRLADVTTTHFSFAGGERAHVFVSWLHPFKEQKLVVVGDKAMAVFDDGKPWSNKIEVYPHHIEWRDGAPQPAKADVQAITIEMAEPLRLECQHFLDCIASGERPRTDGREGLRVLEVLHASERSMETGEPIRLHETTEPSKPRFEDVFIHATACLDEPVEIGAGTKIWHFSHVLGRVKIGRDCVLGQNVVVGPDVTIGNRCKIQNNVSLYKGVTLEDGVFCGPSCVFTNVNNPRAEVERKDEFRPTLVQRGATIGANATIVCGHRIGAWSFIAAGAVVTSDVPAFALMAGVPARRIAWVSRAGEKLGPDLVCPREGRRYREIGPDVLEEIDV